MKLVRSQTERFVRSEYIHISALKIKFHIANELIQWALFKYIYFDGKLYKLKMQKTFPPKINESKYNKTKLSVGLAVVETRDHKELVICQWKAMSTQITNMKK